MKESPEVQSDKIVTTNTLFTIPSLNQSHVLDSNQIVYEIVSEPIPSGSLISTSEKKYVYKVINIYCMYSFNST